MQSASEKIQLTASQAACLHVLRDGVDSKTKSSEFFVSPKGSASRVKVDFNTGYKLESIEQKKVKVKYIRHEAENGPDGAQTGCKQTELERSFTTKEIVYIDTTTGEKTVILYPPPKVKDILCPMHKP